MVLKALNVKPGIVEEPALFHVVIDIGTIEHDLRNLVRLDVALFGHLAVALPEPVPVDEEVLVAGVLAVF